MLDTKRLIDFGEEAEGKERIEAQMILNHKDAIEFLVGSAREIGFNRHTVLNLHALLANNLLADPEAMGRLWRIAIGIEKSAFHRLEVPHLIEECFEQVLATAAAVADPFEQSFFVMVQLPYLQPFDDLNKRVSRLTRFVHPKGFPDRQIVRTAKAQRTKTCNLLPPGASFCAVGCVPYDRRCHCCGLLHRPRRILKL